MDENKNNEKQVEKTCEESQVAPPENENTGMKKEKKHHHDKKNGNHVIKELEQRMHHLEEQLKESEDKLVREKAESI
ncbi:MAG: hypothetical protein KH135_02510, partial [Firmicutes bacterium]|nr:hypothetical protein [Bacillota bacterium]